MNWRRRYVNDDYLHGVCHMSDSRVDTTASLTAYEALDSVAPLACESCNWVTRREDTFDGVRCVMCPRCNDGSLLLTPEHRLKRELKTLAAERDRLADELRRAGRTLAWIGDDDQPAWSNVDMAWAARHGAEAVRGLVGPIWDGEGPVPAPECIDVASALRKVNPDHPTGSED